MGNTPEGLRVITREIIEGSITVETWEGEKLVVTNVAGDNEDRDRYSVTVDGVFFTNDIQAPQMPGPSWSSDPMGCAADAAASFWADFRSSRESID